MAESHLPSPKRDFVDVGQRDRSCRRRKASPMTTVALVRDLSEPDLRVAGLRLWTRAREFPDSTDRWDGNWLQTTALCAYPGAEVMVEGPFLRTEELQNFADQCARLHATLLGEARLDCMEPELRAVLTGKSQGQ